jgi:hypothetical protein
MSGSCYERSSRRGDFSRGYLPELRKVDSTLGSGNPETIKSEYGFGYEGILGTMSEMP